MPLNQINEFLQDLDQELHYEEHRERLKEELTAHIEDAAYERMVNGASEDAAYRESFTQLGSSPQIAHTYNMYMKYRNPLALYTNSLLISIVAGILYFFTSTLLVGQLDLMRYASLAKLYSINHNSINSTSSILLFILYTILTIIALPLFYTFAYRNLAEYLENKYQAIGVLLISLLGPSIIFIAHIIETMNFLRYITGENATSDAKWQVLYLLIGLCIYLINLCSAFFILHLYRKENSLLYRLRKLTKYKNIIFITKVLITVSGLGTIVYSTIASNNMLYRTIARVFLQGFGSLLFIASNYPFNPYFIIGLGIILISIIGLCAYGVYRDLRQLHEGSNRHFSVLKILTIAYLLSIFFLTPPSLEMNSSVKWQVPATNISEQLLKQQTSIFYSLTGMLFERGVDDTNEHQRLHYFIGIDDNNLFFNQDGQRKIVIKDTESLSQVHFEGNLYSKDTKTFIGLVDPESPWENDKRLQCINPIRGEYNKLLRCSGLLFKNKTIFSQQDSTIIIDAKVSANEKWLLLLRSNDSGVQEVDLAQLN